MRLVLILGKGEHPLKVQNAERDAVSEKELEVNPMRSKIRPTSLGSQTSRKAVGMAWLCLSLVTGCDETTPTSSAQPTVEISQQDCEASGAFVYVPAGEFAMGSDRPERDYAYQISAESIADDSEAQAQAEESLRKNRWFDREANREQVAQPAFCIARSPVTQQSYQAFVQATGHRSPTISEADYQRQGFLVHPYSAVQKFLWQDSRPPLDKAAHPVVLISQSDAVAFATWQGEQDGHSYRLPSAQEWEKAARGYDGRYFPWGNDWRDDATNWGGSGLDSTSAVGQFPLGKSPYGVEDMAGNVFEYTESRAGQRVVMKGCSWDDLPGFCRAAYRHSRPPESRHILFGFRLVRER